MKTQLGDKKYLDNLHFQRCMNNWNKYLQSNEKDEDILAEWEEVLLKDFTFHAKECMDKTLNNQYTI